MDVLSKFNELNSTDIKDINIKDLYNLFEYDSKNEGLLLSEFYKMFYKIFYNSGMTHSLRDISVNYITRFGNEKENFKLYYILLNDAYESRFYSQGLNYIYRIKNNPYTTAAFYTEALNMNLIILALIKNYDEALSLIDDVLEDPKYIEAAPDNKFTFLYNSTLLYAFMSDKEKCFIQMQKTEECSKLMTLDAKNQYVKLQRIICNIYLDIDMKKNALELYNLFLNNFENSKIILDYEFELIAIKKVYSFLTSLQLYNLVRFFIYHTKNNIYYKIAFFEILEVSDNEYYSINDRKEYINLLKEFYKRYDLEYKNECNTTNRFIELNDKYLRITKSYQYDGLTKIYNRNILLENEDVILKKGYKVYFFDLDDLKSINDQFGHHVGDICLRKFAEILLDNLKDDYDIYRYGGDEFVAVSKHIISDDDVLKRIYESANKIVIFDSGLNIKFSHGIYNVIDDISLKYALYKADIDMYSRKTKKK